VKILIAMLVLGGHPKEEKGGRVMVSRGEY
jgi:hypothetical protein